MFNTRSRAFSGLWYWLAQIVGSLIFGWFLDNPFMTRRRRAIAGWALLFVLVLSIWGGGLKAELGISRPPDQAQAASWFRGMDIHDTDFTWYCLLYAFYGVLDAAWQTYAYWIMGALSNDPRKLAYFAGFYKVPPPPLFINPPAEAHVRKGNPIGGRGSGLGHRRLSRAVQGPLWHFVGIVRRRLALRHPRHLDAHPRHRGHRGGLCRLRQARSSAGGRGEVAAANDGGGKPSVMWWPRAMRPRGHFFPPGYEREYVMLLVI